MKTMKICEQCGNEFPRTKYIDGKLRNLNCRKRCLDCSPFSPNHAHIGDSPTKFCAKCKRILNKSNFDFQSKKTVLRCHCKECSQITTKERNKRVKRECVEYKGGKCQLCGYSKCLSALDFHHTDDTTKDFSIAKKQGWNFEKLKLELDKCILVCSNCHREIHYPD